MNKVIYFNLQKVCRVLFKNSSPICAIGMVNPSAVACEVVNLIVHIS